MVKMEVGVNPRTKLGLDLWSSEDVGCVNVAGNVICHYRDKSTNNMGSCETGNVTTESRHVNGSNQDGKGFGSSILMLVSVLKWTVMREERKGLPIKVATPQVLAIQGGRNQKPNKKPQAAKGNGKGKGNGKFKLAYSPKPKNPSPAKKEHPKKDVTCHHYKEVGH
nr:zinc finger, CCHC-type [Tanacetum cinerariifolium]